MSRSRSRRRPTASTARVGGTVEYVYCGQNTSGIPLEVVRLVDDRLGVVIELPDVETVVTPATRCATPTSASPVTYDVTLSDLGTTITNHAVVTVRTQEATPLGSSRRPRSQTSTSRCPHGVFPCVAGTGGQGADLPCHVQRVESVHLQRRGRLLGPGRQRPQPRRPPGRARTSSRPVRGTPTDGTGMPKARRSGSTTATTPGQYPGEADSGAGDVYRRRGDATDGHAGDSTPGIAYTASPPGPYSSTTTTTVTVTATLKPRFRLGTDASRVAEDEIADHGDLYQCMVTLRAACVVGSGARRSSPTVTQASCAAVASWSRSRAHEAHHRPGHCVRRSTPARPFEPGDDRDWSRRR